MEPPTDLHGDQVAAYREGFDAASTWASWTFDGATFEASTLRADLQDSFFRGYNDALNEIAQNHAAG